MGLISSVLRALFVRGGVNQLGSATTQVIGALRPNATRQMELGHDAFTAVQAAQAAEFQFARRGRFDAFVNGLNRLPRPLLALSTLGLFVYAMVDPLAFAVRMGGLAQVPEPLWWLLGAVVAFYFGARETSYLRSSRGQNAPQAPVALVSRSASGGQGTVPNPALAAWRNAAEDPNAGRD